MEQSVGAMCPVLECNPDISVQRYYQMARNVALQAWQYLEEGELWYAYLLLRRHSNLVLLTIPTHPRFQKKDALWVEAFKESKRTLSEQERVKPVLREAFQKEQEREEKQQAAAANARARATPTQESQERQTNQAERAAVLRRLSSAATMSKPKPTERQASYPSLRDNTGAENEEEDPALAPSPAPEPRGFAYPSFFKDPTFSSSNTALRPVVLYRDMFDQFLKTASENTREDRETCGVICGKMTKGSLFATTLLIPQQHGTSNSTDTINEEAIFTYQDKNKLVTLGWIHTHPSQTAFLSSVDLHTQYGYQVMLAESVAVVLAPSKAESIGIFHLTDPDGMKIVGSCKQTGFHRHTTNAVLFENCQHVQITEDKKTKIVDLRGGKPTTLKPL